MNNRIVEFDLLSFVQMAVVPVCSKTFYVHISRTIIRKGVSFNCLEKPRIGLESGSAEKQLRSLDTYFGKLQTGSKHPSSKFSNNTGDDQVLDKLADQSNAKKGLGSLDDYLDRLNNKVESTHSQSEAKKGLGSLHDYLRKVNEDSKSENYVLPTYDDENTDATRYYAKDGAENRVEKLKNYIALPNNDGQQSLYDESSDFYLIGILSSINIAVYLFELASPVKNSDSVLFSIPLLYGAKINDLILLGEWWRLLTPMFLHSGFFHLALSCWALVNFGPRVCRAYGSFTFFLIYLLGGISGNLFSFLHTPELTVGGTGPVFAIIGAWLIYEIQNKDASGKDASENTLRKAIIATAFSCILSNFGPIDDWTHLGAAFSGIAYGFLTLPTLQIDDSSSKDGKEEGITLFARRYSDPRKSFLFFSLFIVVLTSLLFIVEPPLDTLSLYKY